VKITKPVPLFKGKLTLGNPEEYETALAIDVEQYPKVMIASPPTASKFVMRGDMSASQPTQTSATLSNGENQTNDALTAVSYARTYQVEDEEAAGGMKDIPYDELAKGYEYGRTAVHISESDRNVTTYETTPGLDIVGFVDKNQYERYLDLGRASLIVASRNNEQASMALSSLIHALYELESYAIARLVSKENKEPKMLLLAPNIDADFECLYDIELPFAEDVRSYKFPPLDRVVTVSGKVLKVHRNLPSDELMDAMSAYMDLSSFGKDDDGEEAEYAALDDTYSPMLHRMNQVIKHRAVHPDAEPPAPPEILTRYMQPPSDLVKQSQRSLDKVIKAADVKKVPPKARGKRFGRKGREEPKPLSDLDIGALLAQDSKRKSKRIDPKNAIPEFKQIVAAAEDISELRDACKQLKNITFDWIRHSVGHSGYGKAVEAIRVFREEMLDLEEPGMFNDFMKELKEKVLGGELGGDRTEMWFKVRQNRLGLIQKKDMSESDVTEEAARAFLTAK
jgi:ATP-dependent DNA helicase 2 subunit 2